VSPKTVEFQATGTGRPSWKTHGEAWSRDDSILLGFRALDHRGMYYKYGQIRRAVHEEKITVDYFDSNNCGQSLHYFARDDYGKIQAYHSSDDTLCAVAEFRFTEMLENSVSYQTSKQPTICSECGGINEHATPSCSKIDLSEALEEDGE